MASGSTLGCPGTFAYIAEAYTRTGDLEKGLPFISEALSIAQTGEEGLLTSDVHRVWGEYLTRKDPDSLVEAEASFRRALEVAHDQGARSLELRAAMPLSRLLHSQGKKDEARELLADIYNWFTEGLDTPDLKDAAALLEELS
jgi:tetratricopeptide (TPR) repeat protein